MPNNDRVSLSHDSDSEPLEKVAQALAGLLGTTLKSFTIEYSPHSIDITAVTQTQAKQKSFQMPIHEREFSRRRIDRGAFVTYAVNGDLLNTWVTERTKLIAERKAALEKSKATAKARREAKRVEKERIALARKTPKRK